MRGEVCVRSRSCKLIVEGWSGGRGDEGISGRGVGCNVRKRGKNGG